MMIRSAATLGRNQLDLKLRAGADGDLSAEAAVELLVAHDRWLGRKDFLHHVLVGVDARVIAKVAWDEVLDANLPASSSEHQVLAICAELAGNDSGQPLGDLMSGLDDSNTILVLRALVSAHPSWRRVDRVWVSPLPGRVAPLSKLGALSSPTLSRSRGRDHLSWQATEGPAPDACG